MVHLLPDGGVATRSKIAVAGPIHSRTLTPHAALSPDSLGEEAAILWTPRRASLQPVRCALAQHFRDAEELIVLRHPIGAAKRTGLDLAGVVCDRNVGNRRVFGLAGTMADHR